MAVPRRLQKQRGLHALVDGIPFNMPVESKDASALMAVFSINADKARELLPGQEIHPFRLWKKALLVVTVINYKDTVIGKYIEFSVAIACTHGSKPAPPLLPGLLMKWYGTGQYVYDLPVSTEISVKGGKGIWGMPKHQANLDFIVGERRVSSQYDLDSHLAVKIEICIATQEQQKLLLLIPSSSEFLLGFQFLLYNLGTMALFFCFVIQYKKYKSKMKSNLRKNGMMNKIIVSYQANKTQNIEKNRKK